MTPKTISRWLTVAALALVGCGTAPKITETAQVSPAACAVVPVRKVEDDGCRDTPVPAELRHKLFHHLRYHESFPADGAQIRNALRASLELSADEQAWVTPRLPARGFSTAAEAFRALFPDADRATLARLDAAVLAQR